MIETLGFKPNWLAGTLHPALTLENTQIHIWWLPLRLQESQTAKALDMLSDIQRDKYARRSSPERRQAYLAGRYYLLTLLGMYTRTSPSDILLSYSRLNKPYLSDKCHEIYFNFTDTRLAGLSHGAFVFCRGREVGIDIEARTRQSNFAAIAEHRFTTAEKEYVTDQGQVSPQKCLAIWTRKEAFGKATGKGINFKMNQQDLSSEQQHELDFFDPDDTAWRLLQLEFGDAIIASVVHQDHQKLEMKAFHSLEI